MTVDVENKKLWPLVQVCFCLSGKNFDVSMDFEAITKALGAAPSKIRSKEDFPQSSKDYGYAVDSWQLNSKRMKSHTLETPFLEVLSQLGGREDAIYRLCEKENLEAVFVISIHTDEKNGYPAMYFSERIVNFCAAVKADIAIDDYPY